MTGLMLLVAVGLSRDGCPQRRAAVAAGLAVFGSVAEGTIVLLAVLGASIGQLLAMLIFVYMGSRAAAAPCPCRRYLASCGGWLDPNPLRQILAGTRAILYFDAQADAGLTRAATAASLGLVFWLVLGAAVVKWYDRKGFTRMDPELLAFYVGGSVQQHKSWNADAPATNSGNAGRQPEPGAQV